LICVGSFVSVQGATLWAIDFLFAFSQVSPTAVYEQSSRQLKGSIISALTTRTPGRPAFLTAKDTQYAKGRLEPEF